MSKRRWTDSLKIRRKKKKDVKVVDNENENYEGKADGEQGRKKAR